MSDEARDIMFRAYHQNPALLGLELEVLFEPCTEATFAVLHNKAIDLINTMCGVRRVEKNAIGVTVSDTYTLECKKKLAGHLARQVLQYARMTGAENE
jgi:hypothetical protein